MNTKDFKRKLTAVFSADVAGYSRLMGEDEAATVKTLESYKQAMFSLIEQDNRRSILLNFENVDFLSSASLGKLITLDRKIKSAQGRLKMSNIRPEILEVFQITKLNKVFDIRAEEAEAISAFQ